MRAHAVAAVLCGVVALASRASADSFGGAYSDFVINWQARSRAATPPAGKIVVSVPASWGVTDGEGVHVLRPSGDDQWLEVWSAHAMPKADTKLVAKLLARSGKLTLSQVTPRHIDGAAALSASGTAIRNHRRFVVDVVVLPEGAAAEAFVAYAPEERPALRASNLRILATVRTHEGSATMDDAIAAAIASRALSDAAAPSDTADDSGAAPANRGRSPSAPRQSGALPALNSHVADPDKQLDATSYRLLDENLDAIYRETGFAIVVWLPRTLDGYGSIEDAAHRAFNTWHIGRDGRDDGILIVVAPQERKIRIETGKGVEGILPDLLCADIIEDDIAPKVKRGSYYAGLSDGIKHIHTELTRSGMGRRIQGWRWKIRDFRRTWGWGATIFVAAIVLVVGLLLIGFLVLVLLVVGSWLLVKVGLKAPPTPEELAERRRFWEEWGKERQRRRERREYESILNAGQNSSSRSSRDSGSSRSSSSRSGSSRAYEDSGYKGEGGRSGGGGASGDY